MGKKIFFLVFIIYSTTIALSYQYYDNKVEIEKEKIIHNYYEKIQKVSLSTIDSLAHQLSTNIQDKNITIRTNLHDIELCYNVTKCINYSLFQFGALLDQYIPEFIYYKIELNKNYLYSNIKISDYQIDKTYHLNGSNQLNISIAINDSFWNKIKADIKLPFFFMILLITANTIMLFIVYKVLSKNYDTIYRLSYNRKYITKLEQLELKHKQELKDSRDVLIKKIWNSDFNKQKDLEINHLFAVEANQIASSNYEHNNNKNKIKNQSNKIPCSIILYQNNKVEEINIGKLIDLFIERFNQENENISIEFIKKAEVVNFSSKAALYQIIYSVTSYLFFLLKEQFSNTKHTIRLSIGNRKEKLQLLFMYDGIRISKEEELLTRSSTFFKNYANPFLLNISQVFNVLRMNGYECKLSYNQSNIIEIREKLQNFEENLINSKDNVILLSSFTEKIK